MHNERPETATAHSRLAGDSGEAGGVAGCATSAETTTGRRSSRSVTKRRATSPAPAADERALSSHISARPKGRIEERTTDNEDDLLAPPRRATSSPTYEPDHRPSSATHRYVSAAGARESTAAEPDCYRGLTLVTLAGRIVLVSWPVGSSQRNAAQILTCVKAAG
jgi:hypothetical protein